MRMTKFINYSLLSSAALSPLKSVSLVSEIHVRITFKKLLSCFFIDEKIDFDRAGQH